jgi:hypothetical protein
MLTHIIKPSNAERSLQQLVYPQCIQQASRDNPYDERTKCAKLKAEAQGRLKACPQTSGKLTGINAHIEVGILQFNRMLAGWKRQDGNGYAI